MDVSEKKFEQWFRSIETGDDDKWELPAYKSPEWHAYLLRRQLAIGAWNASREAIEIEFPTVSRYLAEVEDKTLEKALSLLAKGVRSGDISVIRAAGLKVKE